MIIFDTVFSWLMVIVMCLALIAVCALVAYVLICDRRDSDADQPEQHGRRVPAITDEDVWERFGDDIKKTEGNDHDR